MFRDRVLSYILRLTWQAAPSTRRQPDRRLSGGGDEAESVETHIAMSFHRAFVPQPDGVAVRIDYLHSVTPEDLLGTMMDENAVSTEHTMWSRRCLRHGSRAPYPGNQLDRPIARTKIVNPSSS